MKKKKEGQEVQFMMTSEASVSASNTSTRRNAASVIERTDRFKNIDDGLIPFRNSSSIYGSSSKNSMDVRDAVILCQKCYYNFAVFRNIIDLMTEFSINDIFFRGGTAKSREFFEALFKKINIWDLQDKFFREYYRSGNVFIYRYDGEVQASDIKNITQVYGQENVNSPSLLEQKPTLPYRYVILNPADINMVGTANFSTGVYFKLLTEFEIDRLKLQQTEEDKQIFLSLSPKVQNEILKGARSACIELDPRKVAMIFYKKQDYEPFAVPMGYPVLEDINAKAEMRKMDMALARTMQQIILLVTTGAKPEEGGVNQKNLEALRKLFENQSIGRALIADYTTKAEFVIPSVADLLNPQKYEVLDRDINMGLNNVFSSGEKFANQQQKVDIFVARLEQAKDCFLNNFLIPEIKRISQGLGFKNFPTPYFEETELKDNSNFAKIYARLVELGILTPEQGFRAIETNTLPDPSAMVEEHRQYKKLRDEGLYEPLVGGPKDPSEEAGRPSGTKAPLTKKTVSPIGASEIKFSLTKVKENMTLAQDLEAQIIETFKEKHNIKRFSKLQKEVVADITSLVMANEEPKNWLKKHKEYMDKMEDTNHARVSEMNRIAIAHQVDTYMASLLLASKINEQAV